MGLDTKWIVKEFGQHLRLEDVQVNGIVFVRDDLAREDTGHDAPLNIGVRTLHVIDGIANHTRSITAKDLNNTKSPETAHFPLSVSSREAERAIKYLASGDLDNFQKSYTESGFETLNNWLKERNKEVVDLMGIEKEWRRREVEMLKKGLLKKLDSLKYHRQQLQNRQEIVKKDCNSLLSHHPSFTTSIYTPFLPHWLSLQNYTSLVNALKLSEQKREADMDKVKARVREYEMSLDPILSQVYALSSQSAVVKNDVERRIENGDGELTVIKRGDGAGRMGNERMKMSSNPGYSDELPDLNNQDRAAGSGVASDSASRGEIPAPSSSSVAQELSRATLATPATPGSSQYSAMATADWSRKLNRIHLQSLFLTLCSLTTFDRPSLLLVLLLANVKYLQSRVGSLHRRVMLDVQAWDIVNTRADEMKVVAQIALASRKLNVAIEATEASILSEINQLDHQESLIS